MYGQPYILFPSILVNFCEGLDVAKVSEVSEGRERYGKDQASQLYSVIVDANT